MDLGMLRPILQGSEEEEELAGNRQIFSRIHTDVSRNGGCVGNERCRLFVVSHFTGAKGGHFKAMKCFAPRIDVMHHRTPLCQDQFPSWPFPRHVILGWSV